MRRPIAFAPGQARRANSSSTIATGARASTSARVKSLPAASAIPIVSK
jgi:hypothetical protein